MQREDNTPFLRSAVDWFTNLGGSEVVEVVSDADQVYPSRDSTRLFAAVAHEVYSVSVDPPGATMTLAETAKLANVVPFHGDYLQFLRQFSKPIDLLYLDAWPLGTDNYKERHRELYQAARHRLHGRSLLLINDTDIDFCGKGEKVIHAAEQDGFRIAQWGRQTLLIGQKVPARPEEMPEAGLPSPQSADFDEGLRLHQAGYNWQAARIYEKVLDENPKHACALHLLGLVAHESGRNQEALTLIGRAIALEPLRAAFFSNYGAVLQSLGRMVEAMGCFAQAVSLQRNCPNALSNLASAYELFGKAHRAEKLYREVLEYDPKHFATLHRLGNLLVKVGKYEDAVAFLQRAIELEPRNAKLLSDLGNALASAQRAGEAASVYRKALTLAPGDARTHYMLGEVLAFQDRFDEAASAFGQAARLTPQQPLWKLRSLLFCPSVFRSNEEIDEYRSHLSRNLDTLIANPPAASPTELMQLGFAPPFSLAYQGRIDRPLKEKFAALAEHWIEPVELVPRTGKPRIGFIVTRGHEGVFLRCMSQVLKRMNKREFDVHLFCPLAASKKIRETIKDSRIKYGEFREDLRHARSVIEDARCDVLYFWEVGSDAMNYLLACYKLAPVQCTSWGTHVTSGLSRMDYYLSSKLIEGPEADKFCTEKLWLMETLPTVQQRIIAPSAADKAALGLPPDKTVYLSFQTVLKLHPDQDLLFREVLRRDPQGVLAIKLGPQERPNRILQERIAKTLADVATQIIFIPWQSRDDYHRVLSVADVLLDTYHFGAGTTAYDAFALAKPIVTLPSPQGIGRFTQACYRKMGLKDFVATSPEDYGIIAHRLAREHAFRHEAVQKLESQSGILFDEEAAVTQLEDFFRHAADLSRQQEKVGKTPTPHAELSIPQTVVPN